MPVALQRVFVLIVALLLLFRCSPGGGNHHAGNADDAAWGRDTAQINRVLDRLYKKEACDPDSAMMLVKELERKSGTIGYREGYARALFIHGNLLYERTSYQEALKLYEQAIVIMREEDMKMWIPRCMERMASVHLGTDDPNLALKLYFEALEGFEKNGDKLGIGLVYNVLGVYKTENREFREADRYFREAAEIGKSLRDEHLLTEVTGNRAWMYDRQGKLDSAEMVYTTLVNKLLIHDEMMSLPVIYYDLGALWQKKGNPDSAIFFLDKAISIYTTAGDSSMLAPVSGNKGEILLELGKTEPSARCFETAVRCAQANGDIETEAQALAFLVRIDSIRKDFRSAFLHGERIRVLTDTLYEHRSKNNVRAIELKYRNQKQEDLIAVQKEVIEATRKEKILFIILLTISLITLGFLGVIIYQFRKNSKRQAQLREKEKMIHALEVQKLRDEEEMQRLKVTMIEEEVRSRDRELASIAVSVDQKNEMLNGIMRELKSIAKKEKGDEQTTAVTGLESTVKRMMADSNGFSLFNDSFTKVHPEFFRILKERHPLLTKTELKFCAYLRINLSSSQIAAIQNVTTEAIRKTRYRIRKKMNLREEESLEDYLMALE
jgi:tetratricopeptide (TPR) repeat protein/DNA-binding CsgD family transcriptional regulator